MGGCRIVVVDDNETNLLLVQFLLEALGHTALPACCGEDALDLACRELPDLVLLDLQMSGWDGFETLRAIRLNHALDNVPIVALTALAMVGERETALAAGFDGYITKPIQPRSFASQINPFLPVERRSQLPSPAGRD
jgi:two-component system cell cycle response regulator DivK